MTSQAKPRAPLLTDRLLRRPEVEEITGLSTSAIYRKMRQGLFPRPRRLGGGDNNAVRWRLSDINEWMEQLPVAEPQQLGKP